MSETIPCLEEQLNDFDPSRRRSALEQLAAMALRGEAALAHERPWLNLHSHTFFSFNGYGYSPSYFAWKARKEGLAAGGIVDFDVLDGVDEFLDAGRILGLRACAGMETRVFVEALADKVINSPGEPGVAYFMAMGFPNGNAAHQAVPQELHAIAQRRNQMMLGRINPFLSPVEIDYERDVLPLTPAGNVTERHLCMAYDQKARATFNAENLIKFWMEKLSSDAETVRNALASPPVMQGLIRGKTMKAGGVGYVPAQGPDFPALEHVARFALDAGAVPTYAFLDGSNEGEADMERLFDVMGQAGAAAVNIIPDRNWNFRDADTRRKKTALFHQFTRMAVDRGMPIVVGTEMNAHGQRFVDDFDAPEMAEFAGEFLKGAYVFYAHTLLEARGSMGYCSPWAAKSFTSTEAKNTFYERVGRAVAPEATQVLDGVAPVMTTEEVLLMAKATA